MWLVPGPAPGSVVRGFVAKAPSSQPCCSLPDPTPDSWVGKVSQWLFLFSLMLVFWLFFFFFPIVNRLHCM